VYGAEAIGFGYEMDANKLLAPYPREARREIAKALGFDLLGGRARDPVNPRPWVAEIVGVCPRYRFERVFLPPRIDYSNASSTGNRGVWFWWTLSSGRVYEAWRKTSWRYGRDRQFMSVTEEGDIRILSEEEVIAWLNAC